MLFIISYHSYFSPSRLLDFYLPFDKNTNKETESISYFPLSIISIFFLFSPSPSGKRIHFNRGSSRIRNDRRYRYIRSNPDLFWKYSFLFSRREKERERKTRRFLEKVLEFQRVSRRCECWLVVGFVFPQRGRIEKSEEGRAREEGAKCTPVLRDVTFTFYVYSLRLWHFTPLSLYPLCLRTTLGKQRLRWNEFRCFTVMACLSAAWRKTVCRYPTRVLPSESDCVPIIWKYAPLSGAQFIDCIFNREKGKLFNDNALSGVITAFHRRKVSKIFKNKL